MAKKARNLERLPQAKDIWQVDARPMNMAVKASNQTVRPWMIVVASDTQDAILAFELVPYTPTADDVWKNVVKAMTQPAEGKPHRPTEVLLGKEAPMVGLQTRLAALGIGVRVSDELPRIDQVFEDVTEELAGDRQPGIIDMPSVTPRMVRGLFEAAAEFYRQAPWKKVRERTIRVECSKFESGLWYAALMGQGGFAAGLVLYESLETLNRLKQGDLSEEENARLTSALGIIFGEKDNLPEADLEAVEQYGWKVAGRKAYPVVYRKEPGLAMRPPLVWELELLEGCLRAVLDFVKHPSTVHEIAVAVAKGELPLKLSWVEEVL